MISSWRTTARWWCDTWFAPLAPRYLAAVRIGAGLVAFIHFVALLISGNELLGPNGWFDVDAGRYLIGNEVAGTGSVYRWSPLYRYPGSVSSFAGLGLLASLATIAGIGSRLAPLLAWICLCTFQQRAPLLTLLYEPLLVALMAYLIVEPGRTTWSIKPGLSSGEPRSSVRITRNLIVCHFWIWIAFSLCSMLANPVWWNGQAAWQLMQPAGGWLPNSEGWQWLGQWLTHWVIVTQAAILFCMLHSPLQWLGRWMTYLFLLAVLLLLGDWMYASILLVASLAVWPIPIPRQKTLPS